MAETQSRPRLVRFGGFEADLRTGELRKDGLKLKFSGQPFQVLAILLERPGDVVTREELQKRLWPDTFVDVERNLNTAVNKIREVLGDSAETPRFIETLSRRGYRFIGPLEPPPEAAPVDSSGAANSGQVGSETVPQLPAQIEPTPKRETPKDGRPKRFRWWVSAVAVLALFLVSLGWYLLRPLPPPHITEYVKLTRDGRPKMLMATDGNRLYLNQGMPLGISQVAVAGGQITPITVPVQNPFLWDISPDGSTLLVESSDNKLWSAGSVGDSLRFLANARITSAVWSHNGRYVAYTTWNGEIYRARSDGSDAQKLVSAEAQMHNNPALFLAWSPDDERLRFTKDYQLWEISSRGSTPRKVLPDWHTSDWLCCGRWSPDGAFYVFLSGDSLLRTVQYLAGTQLWALDERHGWLRRRITQPVPLTSGPTRWGRPLPSRDGNKIFDRGVTIRGELERYNLKSREFNPFFGGISAEFLSFSKDGKSVAYVSFPEGILWKANRDGSHPVQLTDPPVYPKSVAMSPDGGQVLFFDKPSRGSNPETYIVSSQGGKPQRLLLEVNEPMMDANWSPDGTMIVFSTCNCDASYSSKNFVRILDMANHQVTTIPGSEDMHSPRWSPDGRYIVALSLVGSHHPRVYDFETKQWSELPVDGVDWPTWSHDSRFIFYFQVAGEDPGVFKISAKGVKAEKVVDLKGFPATGWFGFWFGLDPTDAPLLLRNVGTEDIYALTLDRK